MNAVLRRARWRPPAGILSRRFLSAPTPLVSDDEVAALASRAQHPISLADLVKHGRPPLSDEALLASANFTLSVLPVRLARRIRAIRNLPFIVVSNPNVGRIHHNYADSLSTLLPFLAAHPLRTLADEARFADTLADLVVTHQDTIPILARGFLECRRYIGPADVTCFLDEHLRARIGTRLVAEQHISLHNSSRHGCATVGRGALHYNNDEVEGGQAGQRDGTDDGGYIGVIDTALRPSWVVEACAGFVADIAELRYGVRPALRVDGEVNTTFAFVPMHLSYMVTELLKNAFRASVESGHSREPVIVTIAPEQGSATPPLRPGGGGGDGNAAPGVTIRIRDRGGGIAPDVLPNIWSYSYTTVPEEEDNEGGGGLLSPSGIFGASGGGGGGGGASPTGLGAISAVSASAGASSIAGLGYGLPLSRAYAEYFGGGITVQSLHGWGTDVYLRLKGVGASPASGA